MIAIADSRIPDEAKSLLNRLADVIWFQSENITYEAISGHPDIFITCLNQGFLLAPNTPEYVMDGIKQKDIHFKIGSSLIGKRFPETVFYNALVTEKYFIHQLKRTDQTLLEETKNLIKIDVSQAYTRCNLIFLDEIHFICSDEGIFRKLSAMHFKGIYVDPSQIILPGFEHGFIGGCYGFYKDVLYVIGSLKYLNEYEEIKKLLSNLKIDIIELYQGPLFDGGSIFFSD